MFRPSALRFGYSSYSYIYIHTYIHIHKYLYITYIIFYEFFTNFIHAMFLIYILSPLFLLITPRYTFPSPLFFLNSLIQICFSHVLMGMVISPGVWLPLPHQLGLGPVGAEQSTYTSLWLVFVCVNLGPLWSTSFEDTTGTCKSHSLFLARSYLGLFAESDTTDMCSIHTSLPHFLLLWSVKPYAGFITLQRLVLLGLYTVPSLSRPDVLLARCTLCMQLSSLLQGCWNTVMLCAHVPTPWEATRWETSQRPYVNCSISVTQPDPSSLSLIT